MPANAKLGTFLQAVERGLIPSDSTLLIEDFDRLSRDEIDNALSLFLRIVQSEITLVTLKDEQIYIRLECEFLLREAARESERLYSRPDYSQEPLEIYVSHELERAACETDLRNIFCKPTDPLAGSRWGAQLVTSTYKQWSAEDEESLFCPARVRRLCSRPRLLRTTSGRAKL